MVMRWLEMRVCLVTRVSGDAMVSGNAMVSGELRCEKGWYLGYKRGDCTYDVVVSTEQKFDAENASASKFRLKCSDKQNCRIVDCVPNWMLITANPRVMRNIGFLSFS